MYVIDHEIRECGPSVTYRAFLLDIYIYIYIYINIYIYIYIYIYIDHVMQIRVAVPDRVEYTHNLLKIRASHELFYLNNNLLFQNLLILSSLY